jgi:hypothetical protein
MKRFFLSLSCLLFATYGFSQNRALDNAFASAAEAEAATVNVDFSDQILTIELADKNASISSIELFDAEGKHAATETFSSSSPVRQITLREKGLWLVRIQTNDGRVLERKAEVK